MTVNQNDEINTESVIKIPKEILDESDDDRSTIQSSECGIEEMGAYYSSGPYPVDLQSKDLSTNQDAIFFDIFAAYATSFVEEPKAN